MIPIAFKGHNVVIAKDQPQYLPLPAHVNPRDNTGLTTFCWRLSWRERWKLFWGGHLWHQVMTFNRPLQPQLLSGERPEGLPESTP